MKDAQYFDLVAAELRPWIKVLEISGGAALVEPVERLLEETMRRRATACEIASPRPGSKVSVRDFLPVPFEGNVCDDCHSEGRPWAPAIAWVDPPMPTGAWGLCAACFEKEDGRRTLHWNVPGVYAIRASLGGIEVEGNATYHWPKSLAASSEKSRRAAFRRVKAIWVDRIQTARSLNLVTGELARVGVNLVSAPRSRSLATRSGSPEGSERPKNRRGSRSGLRARSGEAP